MSKEKLTTNEQFCLHYLQEFKDRFVSPTEIGQHFRNGYHSSFASPICKKLVDYGFAERNLRGHYKFIKTS